MVVAETEPRSDGGHIESLLFLTMLRCPVHGDAVMVQRRDGQAVFWCGCVRAGEASEIRETDSRYEIVEVKR